MQPTNQQYQNILTELIKKQILILGPAITLAKARNVKGLTISEDGTVTAISGNPQELIRQLIDQFMELSGLIVKKTMEPILANYPFLAESIQDSQAFRAQNTTGQSPINQPPTSNQSDEEKIDQKSTQNIV